MPLPLFPTFPEIIRDLFARESEVTFYIPAKPSAVPLPTGEKFRIFIDDRLVFEGRPQDEAASVKAR